MRHGKKINHLSRKQGHRRALMANMAISLIEHKRIQTTLAKAKALRGYLEPLVTKSKSNTTHSRRVVFSYLQNKVAVQELFDNIAAKIASRPGGYLRIIRIGTRPGDASEMALIEFVDYNETYVVEKKAKGGDKKKRTRRGKAKKKGEGETASAGAAAVVAEKPVAEAAADAVEDVVSAGEEVIGSVDDAALAAGDAVEDIETEDEGPRT